MIRVIYKAYAKGTKENYVDRANGARLGIFKNTVSDNVVAYAMPQQAGNRTGVRYVKVANERLRGIRISSTAQPVECTILPYTAFELEHTAYL